MEQCTGRAPRRGKLRAVVFDFDGTLSTLRSGWEQVMEPLMLEVLSGGGEPDRALQALVRAYIDESTGIQTIFQMKWLSQQAAARGLRALDPWDYKAEYNRRLLLGVSQKREALERGEVPRETYLIAGSEALLNTLRAAGLTLYAASGTDHEDVVRESQALGLFSAFDRVAGAPAGREDCSKEAVLRELTASLPGEALLVVGDGKVEIRLGREAGGFSLGVASDEGARQGINPVKRRRLIEAGADALVGDFLDLASITEWLGL